MSAEGWAVVISAVGIVFMQALTMVLSYLRERDRLNREIELAVKLNTIQGNVQKIETATNSMKDALVEKTEQEALARGGIEERARADAKADAAKLPPPHLSSKQEDSS